MGITWIQYLLFAGACFLLACSRYLIMTGAYYLIVYKVFDRFFYRFKINKSRPVAAVMKHEITWALYNKINFAILGAATYWLYNNGYLKVYNEIETYGWLYAIAIVPALLVLLDTYFFWLHYLMHRPELRKISHHHIHHASHNVSPWSAFSVHPIEGFFEILSRPLILIFIPLHPYSIAAFLIITFALNIIGHSGYEFFPRNYPQSIFSKFNSCATFHYLHHQNGDSNFSLFFNFWDRIMGTMNPKYESFYAEVKKSQDTRTPPKPSSLKPTASTF